MSSKKIEIIGKDGFLKTFDSQEEYLAYLKSENDVYDGLGE